MLWNTSAINGYAIEASDGQLGTVSDLLFDDVTWAIRWLVVDTGNWLPGRKVLLPLSVLGQPDRVGQRFPVDLTMQQVEDSPEIDTDQPVSRQAETEVYLHYARDPYWSSVFPIGGTADISALSPLLPLAPEPDFQPGVVVPSDEGDPHLRSAGAVSSYYIQATDGEAGHVEDLLVDDGSWHLRYIVVDTANWWPGEKVLIPCGSVKEIDWPQRLMHLDVDRQKIQDSPPYDRSITVDGAYDELFLTYYGIKWVGP